MSVVVNNLYKVNKPWEGFCFYNLFLNLNICLCVSCSHPGRAYCQHSLSRFETPWGGNIRRTAPDSDHDGRSAERGGCPEGQGDFRERTTAHTKWLGWYHDVSDVWLEITLCVSVCWCELTGNSNIERFVYTEPGAVSSNNTPLSREGAPHSEEKQRYMSMKHVHIVPFLFLTKCSLKITFRALIPTLYVWIYFPVHACQSSAMNAVALCPWSWRLVGAATRFSSARRPVIRRHGR